MSLHIKNRAKAYFNEWSHRYDRSILQHLVFRSSHKMFLDRIVPCYKHKHAIRVLDVGCGTGEFISGLARHLEGAEIHGMDLSCDMIRIAKAKFNLRHIKFKVGDVEHLPYADDVFDIITCSHSFHHYPDKKKALTEIYRVLKREGRLMIIDGCRDVPHGNIIFKIVQKIERDVYHMLARELRHLLDEIGFHKINQRRFNFIPLLFTNCTARK